jgi:hypothetical protein
MGVPPAHALGERLGRTPDRLVVLTIDIVDAGYGFGLTAPVAAVVPRVVELVLDEIGVQERTARRRAWSNTQSASASISSKPATRQS